MEQIEQQQVALLARKALLQDELKNLEDQLRQLAAIRQYAASQPQPAPQEAPIEE